jgi:LysR family transcriptional regulator, regulator for genes of the gallate degradation pathway
MAALPNLRHLRVLCRTAAGGGFSAAARDVHLSQPAITQAVRALEAEFDAALFERAGRVAEATQAGRVCAVRARRALDYLAQGLTSALTDMPAVRRGAMRGISAAQLEALVAVVQEGGFGRAARARSTSRTTLHGATRQLERCIGVALFEPTSQGIRPTREALRLAQAATLAASEMAQARAELAALRGEDRGATMIGAMPLALSAIIPAALTRFSATQPHHAVSILDGPYEGMLEALQQGRADVLIGALRESPPADVVQEHLLHDPLSIVVRAGHPLVSLCRKGQRAPTAAELVRYPWIAPRLGSPLRRHFDQLLGARERVLPVPVECNSLAAARAVLLASDRVMLSSRRQVQYEIAAGQLVALAHPDRKAARAIGLTVRRAWHPTGAQRELLETIRQVGREGGAT